MQLLIGIVGSLNFLFLLTLSYPQKSKEQFLVNLADVPCGRVGPLSSQTSQRQRSRDSEEEGREFRIIGGIPVLPEQFPWTVSLQNEWGVHFCGGFIISRKFIITASHCFIHYMLGAMSDNELKKMRVVTGTNNLTKLGESAQTLTIQSITLHPEFSYLYPDFENDIAVIKVDQEIQWNNQVQPSCLSSNVPLKDYKYLNTVIQPKVAISLDEASVAGWGVRAENQTEEEWIKSVQLNQLRLPLWSNAECQNAYEKHGIEWNTKDSHICAGYPNGQKGDTCRGDSGSALSTKYSTSSGSNNWVAIGIVSGGEGCSTPIPGIYTRISYFVDFIISAII